MSGSRVRTLVSLATVAIALTVASPAFAAKQSARPGGGGGGATGSFSLVLKNSTDGVPHYGQAVTFKVTSSTAYPSVNLTCYQNGDWVTNQSVGFYPGWAWSQDFPLSSWKWTSGAADCTATLSYQTSKGQQTLATLSFHVYA
jgi:hypothetical protein